jgi:hypothetical protein
MPPMGRRLVAAAALLMLGSTASAQDYIHGVFVGTPEGPVELIAYADSIPNGQLRLVRGSWEDVPTVDTVQRILCSLPNWKPVSVWMSSEAIFRDEYAERRQLAWAQRMLNVYTMEIRVKDLENPTRVSDLIRQVKATDDTPAYAFVMVHANGTGRYYPVRLRAQR